MNSEELVSKLMWVCEWGIDVWFIHEWVRLWACLWMSEQFHEWVSEWANSWVLIVSYSVYRSEWTHEW